MLIPVWGYGHKDFPRTDINSCCVSFQYGSIFQAHPFPFSAPFALARCDLPRAGLLGMLFWLGHTCLSFRLRQRPSRAIKRYSSEGNQPGMLSQAVTTV